MILFDEHAGGLHLPIVKSLVWPDEASTRLRVMTFNVKAEKAKERPDGPATLASEVARYAPDLLVMQDADGLRVASYESAQGDGPPLFGMPQACGRLGRHRQPVPVARLRDQPDRLPQRAPPLSALPC